MTSIKVNNTDRAPVAVAPATVTGAENGPITVNVSATDPDGQAISALTANLSALPAGNNAVFTPNASKTAGTLTWTPTSSDGGRTFTVTFTAGNARSGSSTSTITVDRYPVLAVPAAGAQQAASDLVEAGVTIIFNYSEALLELPPQVQVLTSNPAAQLVAALSLLG